MLTAETYETQKNPWERPATISELLEQAPAPLGPGEFLKFTGNGELSVYNVTAPFELGGREYLAARVEPIDDEFDSKVEFFEHQDTNIWKLVKTGMVFHLQDPAVKLINGEIILSGVRVIENPLNPRDKTWYTQFWRGRSLDSLIRFADGPPGMKDIRLLQLESGDIGVFTRPQNARAGNLGKAGFTLISGLNQMSEQVLTEAPIIEGLFLDGQEWGGVNEAHALPDGRIGIVCHIARYNASNREYYPLTGIFDPDDFSISGLKIPAQRHHFPYCNPKQPDIDNCFFSGGLKLKGETADLYGGISDARGGAIPIEYPFA